MKAETVVKEEGWVEAPVTEEATSQDDTPKRLRLYDTIQEFLTTDEGKSSVFFNLHLVNNNTKGFAICNDERYYFTHFQRTRGRGRGGRRNSSTSPWPVRGGLCRKILIKYGADFKQTDAESDNEARVESINAAVQNMKNWKAADKVKECFNAEFKVLSDNGVEHTVGVFVDGEKKTEISGKDSKDVTEHQAAVQFLNLEEFKGTYIKSFSPQESDSKSNFKSTLTQYCKTVNIEPPQFQLQNEGTWKCKIEITAADKITEDDAAGTILFQLQNIAGLNLAQKNVEESGNKRKNVNGNNQAKVQKMNTGDTGTGWSTMEPETPQVTKLDTNLGKALAGDASKNVLSQINFMAQLSKDDLKWSFLPNIGTKTSPMFQCQCNYGDAVITGTPTKNKKEAKNNAASAMINILEPKHDWLALRNDVVNSRQEKVNNRQNTSFPRRQNF